MLQVARGERIAPVPVFAPARAVVTTVVAAEGYPAAPRTGDAITLPGVPEGCWLFHAGTAQQTAQQGDSASLHTSGGRVITASATAPTLREAQQRSAALAGGVQFSGAFHRRDIGWRALERGA